MNQPQKVNKLNPDEVNCREAAKTIGIHVSTLYRFIKDDLVPSARRGSDIVLKKTVPMKIKIARQTLSNLPWHQKIQWLPEDLFEYQALSETRLTPGEDVKLPEEKISGKVQALAKIALQLIDLGEQELAATVNLKAAMQIAN